MEHDTALSVCIPTYNRRAKIVELVSTFLQSPGTFELCVHDDGSTDGTFQALTKFAEAHGRIKISRSENQGRANALKQAVSNAKGKFIMLFDDDDDINLTGFSRILEDCRIRLPEKCGGFVYQMTINRSEQARFPTERANLISLRSDYNVQGDKKEVVLASLLKPIITQQPKGRRVPTSLYWTRIALDYDILCSNTVVGNKNYLSGGMTKTISTLKSQSPEPMIHLQKYRIKAFFMRRYKSFWYFLKSVLSLIRYHLVFFWNRLLNPQ